MRALLIVNPRATRTTPQSRDALAARIGRDVELRTVHTEHRGHARDLAHGAAREGHGVVISLGGDGTVNEVVNGLLSTPRELRRPRFAALPGGSANVFVRALGLPRHPARAASTVLAALRSGRHRTVGLGHAVSDDDDRYFTFSAGFGWDADVVHEVERRRRAGGRASPVVYSLAALGLLVRGRACDPSLELRAGGHVPRTGLHLALVTNTTPWTYAGAFPLQPTPRAQFRLGLDVFALTRMRLLPTAWLLSQGFTRDGIPPHGRGHVSLHDLDELTVTSRHPRAFQIDGEYLGHREQVNFRSVPKALRIIA